MLHLVPAYKRCLYLSPMQADSQPDDPPQPHPMAKVIGTAIAALTLVTPLSITAYYSAREAPLLPWFQQVAPYRSS
jgi:hypothetical protein